MSKLSFGMTTRAYFIALIISVVGIIAVYNASVIESFNNFQEKYHFARQQLVWVGLGWVAMIGVSRLRIEFIQKNTQIIMFICLTLLVLVLIPGIGLKLQGSRRWLDFGFTILQPSEPFKLALVLYLSTWLTNSRSIQQFSILVLIIMTLLLLQPDLGTAIVLVTTSFVMYYLSGVSIKKLLVTIVGISILVALLIALSPYRTERVKTFLDPTTDQSGRSYHINQVLLSLGSGGVWGVGIGRSIQKHQYLPEATTDSIFAVIGEEMGFVGGVFIILFFLLLTLYGYKIALSTNNLTKKLMASGISTLLFTQTFINLSAMVALVPLTGVPLPFISYGGSSVVTSFLALGLLINIAKSK